MINSQLNLQVKATGVAEAGKGFEALAKSVDGVSSTFARFQSNITPITSAIGALKKELGSIKVPKLNIKIDQNTPNNLLQLGEAIKKLTPELDKLSKMSSPKILKALDKPVKFQVQGLTENITKLAAFTRELEKLKTNMPKGSMKLPKVTGGGSGGGSGSGVIGDVGGALSGSVSGFSSLSKAAHTAGGAVLGATGVILGVAGAAYAAGNAVYSLTEKIMGLAAEGGQLKGVDLAFNRLGGGTQQLNELRKAVGGAVSDIDLMKAANKALLLDIPKESVADLMKIAVGASGAMGTDIGKAIEDTFTAVGRGSVLIADNMGIIISVEEANSRMAKKLGITTGQLTDAQKKLAFSQEFIRKGTRQMASADIALQESTAPVLANLTNFWNDLKVAIYEAADGSGLFATVMSGVGKGSSPIKELITSLIKDFVPVLQFTISKIPMVVQLMKDLISDFKEVYEFFNKDTSPQASKKGMDDIEKKNAAKRTKIYQTEMDELIALKKARDSAFGELVYQTKLKGYGKEDKDVDIGASEEAKHKWRVFNKEFLDGARAEVNAFASLVNVGGDLNKVIQSFDWKHGGVDAGAAATSAMAAYKTAIDAGKGSVDAYAEAGKAVAHLAGLTNLTEDGFITLGKAGVTSANQIQQAMILTETDFSKTGWMRNAEGLGKMKAELDGIGAKAEEIKQKRLALAGVDTLAEEYSLSDIIFSEKDFENTINYLLETNKAFKDLTDAGKKRVIEYLKDTTAEQKKAKEAQTLTVLKSLVDQQSLLQEDLDFSAQMMYADLGLAGETEAERLKIIQNTYDSWYQSRLAFHKGNEELARKDMSTMNVLFNKLTQMAKPEKEPGKGRKTDTLTPLLQRAELIGKTDYQKKIIELDRQFVKDMKDAGKSVEGQRAASLIKYNAYINAVIDLGNKEFTAVKDVIDKRVSQTAEAMAAERERRNLIADMTAELDAELYKGMKFTFTGSTGFTEESKIRTRELSDREIAIKQEIQALKREWEEKARVLRDGSEEYLLAQEVFNAKTRRLKEEEGKERETQNLDKQLQDFFGPLQSFQAAFSSISGTYQELINEGTLAEQQTAQAIGGLLSLADATVGMQEEIKKTQQAVIEGKMQQTEADILNATTGVSAGIKAAKMFFKNKQAEYFLEGLGETAKAAGQFAVGNFPGGIAHGLAAGLFFKAANRGGGGAAKAAPPPRRSAAGSDRSSTARDKRSPMNQVNIFINPITGQAMVNEMNREGNRREGTKIASRLISPTARRSDM